MPLTPEEEIELQQLEQKYQPSPEIQPTGGLTDAEAEELRILEDKYDPFQQKLKQEQAKVAKLKEPGLIQSTVGGIAQGITLGYSDEIEARIDSALGEKSYDEVLAEVRQRHKEQREAHPVAFGVGEFGASVLPGGAIAKGVGGIVKGGAAIGGIQAAGTSEESITESPREFLTDVAAGAGTGAILGLAGEAVAPLARKGVELTKKGVDKVTPGFIKDYVVPTRLRSDALVRTKKDLKLAEKSPAVQNKFDNAVAVGEEEGLFKTTIDKSLDAVQEAKKKTGEDFKKYTSGELGKLFNQQKPLINNTIKQNREALKKDILDLADEGLYTDKEATDAIKSIEENFGKIQALGVKNNGFDAIRTIRQSLSSKLKSADFQPGGSKAGTTKDVLLKQISKIRELETDTLSKLKEHLVSTQTHMADMVKGEVLSGKMDKLLRDIDLYEPLMKKYSSLLDLEEAMINTKVTSKELLKVGDLTTPTLGYLAADFTGVAGAMVKRSLDTPSGKLALAGVIKGGGKGVDWIASKLKISVDNLTEFLVQRGIKVDNGVLGAIGANQLLRQLKEEDK